MKVVLLALDGDEPRARAALQSVFSEPQIEPLARARIEAATATQKIKLVRELRPHVFAIAMENLEWQRGQTLLSLFGGISGAKEIVAFDHAGRFRRESKAEIMLRAPFRLVREAWLSASAIWHSRRQLLQLERSVREAAANPLPRISRNNNAPKLVFLRATPGSGTQAGGASSHINGFINAAKTEGASITVISNDHIAGLDNTRVPFTIVPLEATGLTRSAFDLRNNLRFTAGALQVIQHAPPDVIYQRYSRFTWAGVNASLLVKRPLFLEYNGSEVWVGKHWDEAGMFELLERFERLNLEAAARVFVVSEVERRNLLRAGVPDEKLIVNPNGVDVERFRPGIGGEQARSDLGIGQDEQLVGFVGTFGPWHGVLELAKAITLVPTESRLRFLLVGTGKLRNETEELLKNADVADRVIFTGAVPHESVSVLLDACNILVAPHIPLADGSDFFGSPTKLFEYMAMGKGIVASRLGQIGEVLVNDETALLVDPGDPAQLANAIVRLSSSPDLQKRLGENARRVVREKYTWRHNARRVLDEYDKWKTQLTEPISIETR